MKFKIIVLSILFSITLFAQDMSDLQNSSMFALNKISVTIGGDFITNGTFPASATERVDEFITRIYNQYRLALLSTTKDAESLARLKAQIDKYAERDIALKHIDGTEQRIDLQKFRLTADYEENPYLLNSDVIIFPQLDLLRNFIQVEGAVNKSTKFQYVEGDKLSCAILFARGISPAYENVDKIEITRLSYDGMNEEIIEVTIEENPILKRGDRITVVANETQKREFKVHVYGEVNRPGIIFLTKNNTTIKIVIEKAGGFKSNANLNNAQLIRRNSLTRLSKNIFGASSFSEEIDFMMINRMADIEVEDSLSLVQDNILRNARAEVTVDFNEVLDDSSENSKFIVKDGDIIYIPEITNLVYIYGQVMSPGFVDYSERMDYQYYIDKSGGIGSRAKSEVFLVKSKTKAWIDMTDEDNKYKIESGDLIWVPKDIPRNFDYYLARTARIAGVIAAVATVILLFK